MDFFNRIILFENSYFCKILFKRVKAVCDFFFSKKKSDFWVFLKFFKATTPFQSVSQKQELNTKLNVFIDAFVFSLLLRLFSLSELASTILEEGFGIFEIYAKAKTCC